jgi:hypothetical protein
MIPWEWISMDESLTTPSKLSDTDQDELLRIVDDAKCNHETRNDFDWIVTEAAMTMYMGYNITKNKQYYDKTGRLKPRNPPK